MPYIKPKLANIIHPVIMFKLTQGYEPAMEPAALCGN